jgi:hypothetical protein
MPHQTAEFRRRAGVGIHTLRIPYRAHVRLRDTFAHLFKHLEYQLEIFYSPVMPLASRRDTRSSEPPSLKALMMRTAFAEWGCATTESPANKAQAHIDKNGFMHVLQHGPRALATTRNAI